jgi:hypothetical protein
MQDQGAASTPILPAERMAAAAEPEWKGDLLGCSPLRPQDLLVAEDLALGVTGRSQEGSRLSIQGQLDREVACKSAHRPLEFGTPELRKFHQAGTGSPGTSCRADFIIPAKFTNGFVPFVLASPAFKLSNVGSAGTPSLHTQGPNRKPSPSQLCPHPSPRQV